VFQNSNSPFRVSTTGLFNDRASQSAAFQKLQCASQGISSDIPAKNLIDDFLPGEPLLT